jgi:GH15 family glucan-1,4-alpha-glucosidase
MVVLRTEGLHDDLRGEGMSTVCEFTLNEGETVAFILSYGSSMEEQPQSFAAKDALADTVSFWTEWTGQNSYKGEYADAVKRSLMTLKAMTYRPSGGIVAAATTSLPEKIGGERNWDYRYCWLRDTSFTLLVLMLAGYKEEAIAWRRWLLRAVAGAPAQVQTIYGIWGDREIVEWEAAWLPGYENSKPVRIGNGAVNQFQLDVFGELVSALSRTPEAEDDIRLPATELQAALVDHLCDVWQQPDEGIWETRGGRQHFTHSKVMAWLALDREIKHFEKYDGGGDIDRWRNVRSQIHAEVCEKGFNKELNSFVQAYGSTELDASCLRIGMVGFLPMDDPRIVGTIDAIQKKLTQNGLVMRYDTECSQDGLPAGEGVFLACSFWMVTSLWLIGRKQEAKEMFERLLALRNDVGLLSEEYDPAGKRMLGNFPQALSHIALVHAAFAMADAWKPQPAVESRPG